MLAGRPFPADPLSAALGAERRGTSTTSALHGVPPSRGAAVGRHATPDRRHAARLLVLAIAVIAAACSRAPAPDASQPASVLAALPAPPSASMTVGAQGPGVDGDAVFYAYTSSADPGIERNAYDRALRSAGFEPVQRSGIWTAYRRGAATVWVSVSADGPPTSIVALVAANPSTIGLPAGLPTDPTSSGLLAVVSSTPPATPDPASRIEPDASGRGAPGSHGNGPGGEPGPSPSPAPSASPAASPTPDATAKPRPSDKPSPSHSAKATPRPKPKPTPRPTPKAKPSPTASPAATAR